MRDQPYITKGCINNNNTDNDNRNCDAYKDCSIFAHSCVHGTNEITYGQQCHIDRKTEQN